MASTISTVDIVNTALDLIGQTPLTSLEEASPLAEKARRIWPLCLDEVLRAHFWKCALARKALVRLGAAPAFGFAHAFSLPGDFVRLVAVDPPSARVALEGGNLVTDEATVAILYVTRLTDASRYDASLRLCLALKLAALLAFGSSASTALTQGVEERYERALREARARDSMEGGDLRLPTSSSWASAKLG